MLRHLARLLLPLVAVACTPRYEYPADVTKRYMEECQKRADRGLCQCTLDELRRTMPYERFAALEQELVKTGVPPKEIQDVANACR